jgi:HTH-type transcriptional regulator/antitoxin HigA
MPVPSGAEMLGYMIREHSLSQSDLPGVGSESVIAEILSGKRQLNLSQARWLAQRFKVSIEVFVPAQEEQLISKCLPHSGGRSA